MKKLILFTVFDNSLCLIQINRIFRLPTNNQKIRLNIQLCKAIPTLKPIGKTQSIGQLNIFISNFNQVAILAQFPLIIFNSLFLLDKFIQNIFVEALGVVNHTGFVHDSYDFLLAGFQEAGGKDAVRTADYKLENGGKILKWRFLEFCLVFIKLLRCIFGLILRKSLVRCSSVRTFGFFFKVLLRKYILMIFNY